MVAKDCVLSQYHTTIETGKPVSIFQKIVYQQVARLIDHTLLKPEATPAQIEQLCDEAARYGFAAVCINSVYVKLAAQRLAGSGVDICTVIGFPLGATTTVAKV